MTGEQARETPASDPPMANTALRSRSSRSNRSPCLPDQESALCRGLEKRGYELAGFAVDGSSPGPSRSEPAVPRQAPPGSWCRWSEPDRGIGRVEVDTGRQCYRENIPSCRQGNSEHADEGRQPDIKQPSCDRMAEDVPSVAAHGIRAPIPNHGNWSDRCLVRRGRPATARRTHEYSVAVPARPGPLRMRERIPYVPQG